MWKVLYTKEMVYIAYEVQEGFHTSVTAQNSYVVSQLLAPVPSDGERSLTEWFNDLSSGWDTIIMWKGSTPEASNHEQ